MIQDNNMIDELECRSGGITARLVCILGYNGNTVDIAINYALILINVGHCILELRINKSDGNATTRSARHEQLELRAAAAALAFVTLFQVVLCLAVSCSGVSIIWCAMCGWIMSRRRKLRIDNDGNCHDCDDNDDERTSRGNYLYGSSEKAVLLLDILAIVYYAVTLPFITTIAHVCALVLGAILFSTSDTFLSNINSSNVEGEMESAISQSEHLLPTAPTTSQIKNYNEAANTVSGES